MLESISYSFTVSELKFGITFLAHIFYEEKNTREIKLYVLTANDKRQNAAGSVYVFSNC